MEKKKGIQAKKYACTVNGCGATFPRPSKLAIHLQLHEGKKPFECNIDNCMKHYTTKAHLKRHQDSQHATKGKNATKIKCSFEGCTKEYTNTSNMQRHIKRQHNRVNRSEFTCDVCQQSFTKKKLLHQHSYLHSGEFYYKCDLCGDGFSTLKECNRHKNSHSMHKCEDCGLEFDRWSDLRKHRTIHRAVYKCGRCQYKTYSKNRFEQHRKTHLPFRKRTLFPCTYEGCDRTYLYERNVKFHIQRYHERIEGKMLPCPHKGCKTTFPYPSKLKKHLVIVHPPGPVMKIRKPRRARKDRGKKRSVVKKLIAGALVVAEKSAMDETEGFNIVQTLCTTVAD